MTIDRTQVKAAAERVLSAIERIENLLPPTRKAKSDTELLANSALGEVDSHEQLVFIVNALAVSRLECSCRIGCYLCDPVADFVKKHKGLIKPRGVARGDVAFDVRSRVCTNCNVCGIPIRTFEEEQMGMCEPCANN